MPMFEWNLQPGQTVSGQFWIYWAVTLPLTFAVIAVWLLWTNSELILALRPAKFQVRSNEKLGPEDDP